jgi:hypothetical protein
LASTAAADRLTETHRLAQARLGAGTVRYALAAWRLLDIEDLDGTFDRWLAVIKALVAAQRQASTTLAANYMIGFRMLELGSSEPFAPTPADPVPDSQLAVSMLVTGPGTVRGALGRGLPLARAVELGMTMSAAAAMRHALNGGRDTIVESVRADRRALGWARATSGRACHFCAMLASRGPVYSEDTSGFRAHDHCSCTAEPVYRPDADWPAGARRYREIWNEATAGLSGADARNAFRQALASA